MFALLVLGFMMMIAVVSPLLLLNNEAEFNEKAKKAEDIGWKITFYSTIVAITWFGMTAI